MVLLLLLDKVVGLGLHQARTLKLPDKDLEVDQHQLAMDSLEVAHLLKVVDKAVDKLLLMVVLPQPLVKVLVQLQPQVSIHHTNVLQQLSSQLLICGFAPTNAGALVNASGGIEEDCKEFENMRYLSFCYFK